MIKPVANSAAYNFWLSYNANNSPKTRAFVRRDCASETGKAKPQIPRFWPVCRLGWSCMLKNRVAGSNTQRTLSQPTPNNKDLASTHRLGVGGWALCVECLLRALLALSASFVVPRRTTIPVLRQDWHRQDLRTSSKNAW